MKLYPIHRRSGYLVKRHRSVYNHRMPSLAEIHAALAAGQKRTALRDLARFLKDEPASLEAWLLLGQNVDDPQRKADCYRKVLELDPENPLAKQGLDWLYTQPNLGIGPSAGKAGEPGGQVSEVLEPLGGQPAPARSRRWLKIVLPIVGALLVVGLGLGIWVGLGSRQAAHSSALSATTSSALPTITGTPELMVTPLASGNSATVSTTPDPMLTNADVRIIYALGSELWEWRRGHAALLADTSLEIQDLQVSSDGTLGAFLSMDGLWVIPLAAQSHAREVANPLSLPSDDLPAPGAKRQVHAFTWLPGSHLLVMDSYQVKSSGEMQLADDLILIDTNSGELEVLLPAGRGGTLLPSPDGSRLALMTPTLIQIYDLENAMITADFLYQAGLTPEGIVDQAGVYWSADSTSLLAVILPADALNDRSAPVRLWRMFAGEGDPELLSEVYTFNGTRLPSPNLQIMAYTLGTGAPVQNVGELHTAAADGSRDAILFDGQAASIIGWTPDSTRLVVRLANDPTALWLVNVSSGAEVKLMAGLPADATVARLEWLADDLFLIEVVQADQVELRLGGMDAGTTTLVIAILAGAAVRIPFGH